MLKRKRQKLPSESELLRQFQSGNPRFMVPPSSFIDQPNISVPIKEEPETSPNPYGGLYTIPSTSVLCQPQLLYNSRTPSPLEYQFPTSVVSNPFYGQSPFEKNTARPPSTGNTVKNPMSGCIATEICPELPSQNTPCQMNSVQPAALISSLPCPTEDDNKSSLMEGAFTSLDYLDSSDLRDITMMEDSEQVLSANLSASLQLADNSTPEQITNEENAQENMTDSYGRIANNVLNEFLFETNTKSN